MKKAGIILLAAMLLTGCGNRDAEEAFPPEQESVEETQQEEIEEEESNEEEEVEEQEEIVLEENPQEEEQIKEVYLPEEGSLATENTVYCYNVAVRQEYSLDVADIVSSGMGTAEVSYSKCPTPFKYEPEEIKANYTAPEGYEWRETEILFQVRGGVLIDYFYNACTFSGDNVESDWERVYDDVGGYDSYDFVLHYNGKDYTKCKLLCSYYWEDAFTDAEFVELDPVLCLIVLLPEGYEGNLEYTVCGTQLVDDEVVVNDAECLVIPF